jgi:hypothetical protein
VDSLLVLVGELALALVAVVVPGLAGVLALVVPV